MAISRAHMGDTLRSALGGLEPNDGLTGFAVWTERDFERNITIVTKIEVFDPTDRAMQSCSGVVRAKDELDAWSFVNRLNQD